MRDNILLAQEWSRGMSASEFQADRKTFYAVTRCMEIISEASRRLPPELLQRHVDYPWREMRDAGNVYRHFYEGVAERIVFDGVHGELPGLLTLVEQELAAAEAP